MLRSPFSEHAASRNASLWAAVGTSVMLMVGWMVGTTWDTLPTSLEPMPDFSSGVLTVSPSAVRCFAYSASKDGVRTVFSTRFW